MSRLALALNASALMLGVVAALLLAYFPPRVQQYSDKGEGVQTWVGTASPEHARKGVWQVRLSKVGPLLLAGAFALQLAALFVS